MNKTDTEKAADNCENNPEFKITEIKLVFGGGIVDRDQSGDDFA